MRNNLTLCRPQVYHRKQRLQQMTLSHWTRIILGFPWLMEQNPTIDWKTRKIKWKEEPRHYIKFKWASPADAVANDERGSDHSEKETNDQEQRNP